MEKFKVSSEKKGFGGQIDPIESTKQYLSQFPTRAIRTAEDVIPIIVDDNPSFRRAKESAQVKQLRHKATILFQDTITYIENRKGSTIKEQDVPLSIFESLKSIRTSNDVNEVMVEFALLEGKLADWKKEIEN